ncbi:hypothetical protein ACLB2K_008889 [Fragaria x ananassa]
MGNRVFATTHNRNVADFGNEGDLIMDARVRNGCYFCLSMFFCLGNLQSTLFTLTADDKTFCSSEDIISNIWMLKLES